jgi:phenylpropionate dioxygenase-like ring-hydroxylating dioxygenase large terminal subunit
MSEAPFFLNNIWYVAMPAATLRSGKMIAKRIANQPIVFARTQQNQVFALRNVCPHRGIPLSYGKFDGHEIECCYHGWCFNAKGTCTKIPSLTPSQNIPIEKIQVQNYPCKEQDGLIWVYLADEHQHQQLPEPPRIPTLGCQRFKILEKSLFPCHLDHAVIGLMDPAHGPFVHRSWWWRSKRSIHQKSKHFAPTALGFKMVRHQPSKNSGAYKLLGGEVSTEIEFCLPGVRVEQVKAGKHQVVSVTTLTPITDKQTEIHQLFYWNSPLLTLAKPVLRYLARTFLQQDKRVVVWQQEGLQDSPRLMLINDADKQAKWYFQIKKAYQQAYQSQQAYTNPIKEEELHWCS